MQYCVHQAYIFFTVGQLWDKLANLRSYYCKELKKVTDSKKVGQELMKSTPASGAILSHWILFLGHKSFPEGQQQIL